MKVVIKLSKQKINVLAIVKNKISSHKKINVDDYMTNNELRKIFLQKTVYRKESLMFQQTNNTNVQFT